MKSLICYVFIQSQTLPWLCSSCFVDEVKIQIELDTSHEDIDDAEADKLLFGSAKVRRCELNEEKILIMFHKLAKKKRTEISKSKIYRGHNVTKQISKQNIVFITHHY